MAVYTKVSSQDVETFLRVYNIGTLREFVPIEQGIENSNYYLYTSENRYVLTLYERRVHEADLPFFLALMEHLAGKNIPCPVPVRDKEGKMLNRLADRPATIVSHLYGSPAQVVTPDHCVEVGRMLANLHRAATDFPMQRPNNLSLTGWRSLFAACEDRAAEILPGLNTLLQDELDFLKSSWPSGLPQGIIHADLFSDNVFFDDTRICGVFDFYFACNDILAYDLAVCMNAWCFEKNGAFNMTRARSLVKGYNDLRPLLPEERNALPVLARGAALRFLLTRLYDKLNPLAEALVKPKDPLEYMTRLQFHQMVPDVNAYGFTL